VCLVVVSPSYIILNVTDSTIARGSRE
jgi:hypothetical protein